MAFPSYSRCSISLLFIVVEDIATAPPSFNIDAFIPKLRDYLRTVNPHKRQFLVSWISAHDSVPTWTVPTWTSWHTCLNRWTG